MKNEAMWTAEAVILELEDALRTLRALPHRGPSGRLASLRLALPSDAWPGEPSDGAMRLPTPKAAAIDRMDAVLRWTAFIPADRYTLRRIILLRAITDPATCKPTPWARIGREIGANPVAVRGWHSDGITIIVRRLNAARVPLPAGGHG